jgi:SAM-dependent methyltransferase
MAVKPNFTKKKKRKVYGATFWDKEYTSPEHLKLSTVESGDLAKFIRFLERTDSNAIIKGRASVFDVGCGNGRNLIYLAKEFGMRGTGVDISAAAIAQARRASEGLAISYHTGSAAKPLAAEDGSQSLVLDMMTSHFLNRHDRYQLRDEIYRILAPGGWLFMKTFLKDEDVHTARLLREHPGKEPGTYIHPVMGVPEFVYSEEELVQFLGEKFIIRKIYRSHRHLTKGGSGKRRTIAIYAEKDYGVARGEKPN